jgi:hypothetical protein
LGGGTTLKTKDVEALFTPSLTVIVIVEVPVWPVAGVTVMVRLPPVPPNTILLNGTKARFDEFVLKVSDSTGVSTSAIVNGIAAVLVLT